MTGTFKTDIKFRIYKTALVLTTLGILMTLLVVNDIVLNIINRIPVLRNASFQIGAFLYILCVLGLFVGAMKIRRHLEHKHEKAYAAAYKKDKTGAS